MPNFPLGGGAPDWFANYQLEAQRVLQLAPAQTTVVIRDDFFNLDDWGTADAGVQVTNKQGGVVNGNAGASKTTISDSRVVLSDSPWYQAFRFKYSAAVSGNVLGYAGMVSSSVFESYCLLGMFSAANVSGGSDTLYVHQLDGASTTVTQTATNVDTGYHDFRQWYTGSALCCAIDADAPVSINTAQLPAATAWYAAFGVSTGTNGHWDKMLVVTGLPT